MDFFDMSLAYMRRLARLDFEKFLGGFHIWDFDYKGPYICFRGI